MVGALRWRLCGLLSRSAPGGDGGIPGDAAGDHDMDPAQQGGRACGPGLLAGQPVVLPDGQVAEPRGHHRALNTLLADRSHRYRTADSVMTWWLRDPVEFPWMDWINEPESDQVTELVGELLNRTGRRPSAE
jgi:hypothetical protein